MNRTQLAVAIESLMRLGGASRAFLRDGVPIGLSLACLRATGGPRPDGLRDDAPAAPGFSFAVAEVALVLDTATLPPDRLAVAHGILWIAGTDDWMVYSHFGGDAPTPGARLALTFSSGYKGADVIEDVVTALGFPLETLSLSAAGG